MKKNLQALIQKLPSNTSGKDYVIGDLHGCFNLLERLLTEVAFDEANDRLFSVGDLADRGPDPLLCLELLAEPWFYAVQGNHEAMLMDFFQPYLGTGKLASLKDVNNTGLPQYGGSWIVDYYLSEQEVMADEFNRALRRVLALPLILVVGEGDSRFHIVHAELVKPGSLTSDQLVWLNSDIDQWLAEGTVPEGTRERLLWGRKLMHKSGSFGRAQNGLSTTFCGHTPQPAPCQSLSHVCVDTGAFLTLSARNLDGDYGLTLFNAHQSCWFTASYQ
ncbi:MAG: metallophosphoesterase, partial [Methyloglobulus sp.]